jgi:putative protease
MELLAPAGGFEQLRAAIDFGADAVYLAANRFGMRARAANFSMEELPQAVAYAHSYGVSVHVTCNVMVMQDELAALPGFLESVAASGADALIIGDMGAFRLARKHAPGMELHVSTQASVANSESALAWAELGAKRIVCAREMSLAQIAKMRSELPKDIQIEAFAHGAQCMAVSGRCLISAYMADRSGNRGHCTQPCRWLFFDGEGASAPDSQACDMLMDVPKDCDSLVVPNRIEIEEETRPGERIAVEQDAYGSYIFNARDLNMSAHLRQMEAAGIDSIKIEGRNKKAFYVATVVGAYRAALDDCSQDDVARELDSVSHRPYSTGFYFGEARAAGQACDYDGYEQQTLHVADIVAVERVPYDELNMADNQTDSLAVDAHQSQDVHKDAPSVFRMTIRCRNRVAQGDVLETLEPEGVSRSFIVCNLKWVGDDAGEMFETPRECDAANRSCNLYTVDLDFAPDTRGFIRRREFRRTGRHLK